MGTTGNLQLPYPSLSDENNAPRYIQELAEAVDEELDTLLEFGPGDLWGTAYNAAIHRKKIYADSVVSTPTANGDVDLLVLTTKFVGIASATCTIGDITTGRESPTWIFQDTTLVARVFASNGAVAAGSNRLNFVVYGWTNR